MSLKFVAACIALFCAKPFPCHAQGAPKSDCTDPAAIGRQQTVDSGTVDSPLLRTLTTAEGSGDQQLNAYLTRGTLCEIQHRFADSEHYYQSAYTLAKSAFGERSGPAVRALHGVGAMRMEQGRIREADVSLHQVLRILQSDNTANPLDVAAVLNSLAVVQEMSGSFSRASALMRKVVQIVETDPTAEAVDLGTALSNLAIMLRYVGNQPEAVTAAERAGSILECCRDTEPYTANLVIRGLLHLDEGDLAKAETMLLRALSTTEDPRKQGSPAQADVLTHLGAFYARNGRHREAEPYFQRALEINRRLLPPDHPKLLDSMGAYAVLLRATRRKNEAKKLEAYIDEHRQKYRADNPALANAVDVHSLMKQSGH